MLLVAALLVATLVFHVQDHIGDLIRWIEEHRVIGSVCFVALYALFTGDKCNACLCMVSMRKAGCDMGVCEEVPCNTH